MAGCGRGPLPLAVNVSRVQFYTLDFVETYIGIKKRYDIPDGLLELEFTESIFIENVELLRTAVQELRQAGHKPYSVPVGGSVALGSLGYALCVQECVEQAKALGVHFDDMVCCAGSGGTMAGVLFGSMLYTPDTRVTGIVIDPDDFATIVSDLVNQEAQLLESPIRIQREDVNLYDCYGAGYAIPSPEGEAAIRTMATQEGLILDPVYTGKTFAGFLQLCGQGYFDGRENILFLHSGGAGGLFAIGVE